MTTRVRFAIAAALASIVAVLIAGIVAIGAVESSLDDLVEARLGQSIGQVRATEDVPAACASARSAASDLDRAISVLVGGGERCRSNAAAPSPRALGVDQRADGVVSATVDGEPWRVATAPGPGGSTIVVAESVAAAERASASAVQAIILAMVAGIVVATFAGAVAAAAATGRISRLLARIRTASTDPTGATRVGRVGGRDLDGAGAAFDQLLDELRDADEAQRRLFADAAHELRTPLTSIRTNAQLLERDASLGGDARDIASRIARQGEGVARLVSQLVDHASVGAWTGGADAPVLLAGIARAAIDRAHVRWPDAVIELDADESELAVDPELVARAVGNLIDNAVAHGDGTIRVSIRDRVIAVEDDGAGFDADLREHALEPFVSRGGQGAVGSGLGLAFVDHVARAHGGHVEIAASGPTRIALVLEPSAP